MQTMSSRGDLNYPNGSWRIACPLGHRAFERFRSLGISSLRSAFSNLASLQMQLVCNCHDGRKHE